RILQGVAVEQHPPATAVGYADAVVAAHHRGEAVYHQQQSAVLPPAQPGVDAVAAVIANQPLKAVSPVIPLVQGRVLTVQLVQVTQQLPNAPVLVVLQQIPVQLPIMAPFAPLAELA